MAATRQAGIWGYIEGYYGRLFGWEERESLIDHMSASAGPRSASSVTAYLYAPKEDALHRRDWRKRYPSAWRARFSALVAHGRRRGVEVIPGMAPGLSFDYLSARDYRSLLGKLRDFQAMGCRTLALLMDDIPAALPPDCRGSFANLGEAHALLLGQLLADLRSTGPGIRFWFCPTIYTDQFATDGKGGAGPAEQDPYLRDLAALMPRDITLMWTGKRIIAERLDSSLAPVAKMFGGNVVLWDNLYANDYCPNKVFLGPYAGRTPEVWKMTRGALLNPTGLPATDRLLLDLLAAFRRGEKAGPAWKAALARYGLPREFLVVAPFLASPFFRPGPADLAPRRVAALRKALKYLIWDWKGTLHQEWYPYLFMLDADLKASEDGEKDAEWVRKRYSPLVARLLLRKG